MNLSLIIPSFIAGLLTFLAPCTLPLVPGFLSFISGVSSEELSDQRNRNKARQKVFMNGVFYVLGFSWVFITLGILFGIGGYFIAPYRIILSKIGGAFVIFFGLYLLGIFHRVPFLKFLHQEKTTPIVKIIKPGNLPSSFLFGSAFAFGWTPCVGPVLASILVLASSTATVGEGALFLGVFSLGLALPFLLVAWGIGRASQVLKQVSKYLRIVSLIGGVFLIFLGLLLLTDRFSAWLSLSYQLFRFINYDSLLKYF